MRRVAPPSRVVRSSVGPDLPGRVVRSSVGPDLPGRVVIAVPPITAPPDLSALHEGDGVELFLDARPDERLDRAAYIEGTYQLLFSPGEGDPPRPVLRISRSSGKKLKAAHVRWKGRRAGTGYRMEISVPFAPLGIGPERPIGFDVAVDDADGGNRENQLIWLGQKDNYRNRFRFGCLRFEERETAAPVRTAGCAP